MLLQSEAIGYLSAFIGGVMVSFTPCVYPLIPITLSFIGVKGHVSHMRGLCLSLVYVLGLAITYSLLGLIASLTGTLFGRVAASPITSLVVGNVCIISGLSFLDVIHFNVTGLALQNKIKRTGGYFPVFLLGVVSGLVATPCTAPALGTILVYVASKQNILYGSSLLFVFAYGMGFSLILAGTVGHLIIKLPGLQKWLYRMQEFSGFVLIVMGEYFIIQAGRLM